MKQVPSGLLKLVQSVKYFLIAHIILFFSSSILKIFAPDAGTMTEYFQASPLAGIVWILLMGGSFILCIVAYVYQLLGVTRASVGEKAYTPARYLTIAVIICYLLGQVPYVGFAFSLLGILAELALCFIIITTTNKLLSESGDSSITDKGLLLWYICIGVGLLDIACVFVTFSIFNALTDILTIALILLRYSYYKDAVRGLL